MDNALPDLRISVRAREGQRYALTVSNRFDDVEVVREFRTIAEDRVHLGQVVEAFKQAVPQRPSEKSARNALRKLLQLRGLLQRVFGATVQTEIRRVLQFRCPRGASDRPPLITIDSNIDHFLPIELLPLTDFGDAEGADLEAFASQFPGFSCVVQREFPHLPRRPDEVLEGSPPQIRFFCDQSLAGARREQLFFQRNKGHLAVCGPWPAGRMRNDEFVRELAALLWSAADTATASADLRSDHIQHFACHCEVNDGLSFLSLLRLSGNREVTIDSLQSEFWTLHQTHGPRRNPGPLVFLNACESSRVVPMGATSFPSFFVGEDQDFYNLGFIGTEANLPDLFAAEFAECFYFQFLEQGLDLGLAMHKAKWTLLQERKNPLGLLYTLFANPSLHVAQPVKGLRTRFGRG